MKHKAFPGCLVSSFAMYTSTLFPINVIFKTENTKFNKDLGFLTTPSNQL